jgi:predicted Zn-dependent protease
LLLLTVANWIMREPEPQEIIITDSGSVIVSLPTDTPLPTSTQISENAPRIKTTPAPMEATPTRSPLKIPGTDIEVPRITDEEEIEIGREIAAEVEAEFGIYQDKAQLARVAEIAQAIIPLVGRPHMPYTFTLLDTDEINAFAVPGGFIYITRGMLDFVRSDDELAGVIGHEIAHVARRHGTNRLEALALAEATGRRLLQQESHLEEIYATDEGEFATEMAAVLLLNGWSRDNEFEADEYGTIYMARAGYDPQAVNRLFKRMDGAFTEEDDALSRLLDTHPPFADRIEWVEIVIVENEL